MMVKRRRVTCLKPCESAQPEPASGHTIQISRQSGGTSFHRDVPTRPPQDSSWNPHPSWKATFRQKPVHCTFIRENTSPTTLIMHTTVFLPPHGDEMPLSVCAADLAQSADPRESNAGLDMLDSLLHDFNRKDNHAVTVS